MSYETVELPSALKGLLNFTTADSIPGKAAATTLATAVETLARKYIAGSTLKEALKSIEKLRKQSMTLHDGRIGRGGDYRDEGPSLSGFSIWL